ncbi:J domain-containing protein [Halobacterium yunchengense]|uniref:J domain-containing protein n=1 Tax=Halobacterium yunchengense TaxID=3108497 RepID=UPI003008B746
MLPGWLAAGLAVVGAVTVLAAVLFVVAERRYPTRDVSPAGEYDGERKRRREIREYLRAIGEPFAEDHPVGGDHVAFYLPQRDVAVTFDAPAYFRLRGGDTHVVLAEHELPGRALGGRLPFETPPLEEVFDDGADGADGADSVAAAFETLGVDPSADAAAVKRAYRERVKDVHPDHGGSREAFERVREAYATAQQALE